MESYTGTDALVGSYFFESSDGGITWNCVSRIQASGNETALVELPGGIAVKTAS